MPCDMYVQCLAFLVDVHCYMRRRYAEHIQNASHRHHCCMHGRIADVAGGLYTLSYALSIICSVAMSNPVLRHQSIANGHHGRLGVRAAPHALIKRPVQHSAGEEFVSLDNIRTRVDIAHELWREKQPMVVVHALAPIFKAETVHHRCLHVQQRCRCPAANGRRGQHGARVVLHVTMTLFSTLFASCCL